MLASEATGGGDSVSGGGVKTRSAVDDEIRDSQIFCPRFCSEIRAPPRALHGCERNRATRL
jgi:hypothetical protein